MRGNTAEAVPKYTLIPRHSLLDPLVVRSELWLVTVIINSCASLACWHRRTNMHTPEPEQLQKTETNKHRASIAAIGSDVLLAYVPRTGRVVQPLSKANFHFVIAGHHEFGSIVPNVILHQSPAITEIKAKAFLG